MRAVLVCNGSISDYGILKEYIGFRSDDYIISVDGGAGHLRKMEVLPSILIGDFDSASSSDIEHFSSKGIDTYKFPPEKDMTDSELAIEKALEYGADELIIVGAIGSRLDHSLANILLLKKLLDKGVKACIINEKNQVYMFDTSFSIKKQEGYKLSLIPVSNQVSGVSTTGLKYKLSNATMQLGTSWGVSNEFEDDLAYIEIKAGILLVCLSID